MERRVDRDEGSAGPEPRLPVDRARLEDFCRRRDIHELAFFGSVLRDDFGPNSDVDVLVTFAADARPSLFDLVRMEDELSEIVGRRADLVDRRAVEASENWIRRREILTSAEVYVTAG